MKSSMPKQNELILLRTFLIKIVVIYEIRVLSHKLVIGFLPTGICANIPSAGILNKSDSQNKETEAVK